MARSTARKRALNTLYEADEKGQDILSLLDERIAVPGVQSPLPDYAIEIVRGVADHLRDIDATLNEYSTGWKVRRMAVVDRNILRIAAWEIMYNPEVPDKVAIDEALGLAKTLCDDDAPAFIHGLLSAVCAGIQQRQSEQEAAEQLARQSALAESEIADAAAVEDTSADSADSADSDADAVESAAAESANEESVDDESAAVSGTSEADASADAANGDDESAENESVESETHGESVSNN